MDENRVLRAAVRKLKEDRDLNQAAVGRILGIKQQNAGRLLSALPHVGMGRATANNLARELGFRDAEDLLLQSGVVAALAEPQSNKAVAIAVARRLSYDAIAIDAVVARYTSPEHDARPIKWWVTKFGDEERERAADRASDVVPLHPRPAPAKKSARSRNG